jgi:hypothetical protein
LLAAKVVPHLMAVVVVVALEALLVLEVTVQVLGLEAQLMVEAVLEAVEVILVLQQPAVPTVDLVVAPVVQVNIIQQGVVAAVLLLILLPLLPLLVVMVMD